MEQVEHRVAPVQVRRVARRQVDVDRLAAPAERATKTDAVFVTADDVLLRAAEQPDADPASRIAGLLLAIRETDHDLALRLCEPLREKPPADATKALAFARVLRYAPLPDELRKAAARKIEETAIAALPEADFPTLTAMRDEMVAAMRDDDAEFEHGLDVILAGLQARLDGAG